MERLTIDGDELADFIGWVRSTRFGAGMCCVHCGFRRVHLHGRFRHRQRYRCARCRRTFSDLTGTPLAYSKDPVRWEAFAACLHDGLTIRAAAAVLGLSPSTVFRWRHAVLAALDAADATMFEERVELDDVRVIVNEKGRRDLQRPPRRRGVAAPWSFRGDVVRMVAACDRAGNVGTGVAWTRMVFARDLVAILAPRVYPGIIVHARSGRISQPARFARSVGAIFRTVTASLGAGPDDHIFTVTAYRGRLKQWLLRFRGVATKYLDHYLAWHRLMDRVRVLEYVLAPRDSPA